MARSLTSRSAEIRARLSHPVIDADGHHLELFPLIHDYVDRIGGSRMTERFRTTFDGMGAASPWSRLTPKERRETLSVIPPWWGYPTKNSLDRVTASIPRLLYERLDELGIDFSVVYPTRSVWVERIPDEELRRVACRATNTYLSELYAPYADRLCTAAMIPMYTPQEAIDELQYVAGTLGVKVISFGHVRRPVARGTELSPSAFGQNYRLDNFGIDSDYDYDPVWAKCVELKMVVTSHSAEQGVGSRTSSTNWMFNHLGNFAASHSALLKSLFLGGVTRRFPTLNFGFMEVGVHWACGLYADMVTRWEKRNGRAIQDLNPENLDQALINRLIDEYGDDRMRAKREELREFYRVWGSSQVPRPEVLDDWAACQVETVEELRDLFVPRFYFGCEADDPLNSWAFKENVNPHGARLRPLLSSDIGHWDVPDVREVLVEAYEQVERGLMTGQDFRDFVFTNPVRFFTDANPDFFKGTRCEIAAMEWLRGRPASR